LVRKIYTLVVLLAISYASYQALSIYQKSEQLRTLKEDYAEITKLNYGLFNIQKWKSIAFNVFNDEIDKFTISSKAFDEAEAELRKYLYGVHDKYIATGVIFDEIIADAEKQGKVNKIILKLIKDNVKTEIEKLNIKSYVPSMANQLAIELKKQEPRLRDIMQAELSRLLQFDEKYPILDSRNSIYKKYDTTDFDSAYIKLKTDISARKMALDKDLKYLFTILIGISILTLSLTKLITTKYVIALVSVISLVLLGIGINLPMIEIDARMNSFVFNLFDKDISFGEQSVLFQSKSILGVTKTLLDGKGVDLKVVGYMVLCFSVIFPAIKLILSGLFLNFKKLHDSKFVQSTIFYLGKWSMADVFVVALFMAYIGFFGLVDGQLNAIEQNKGGFAVETVNYTHLGPGALFFTAYCVLSILLGIIIYREKKRMI
jgi:hypothetical protein